VARYELEFVESSFPPPGSLPPPSGRPSLRPSHAELWSGVGLVLISAVAFSAKAVGAKLLYREGLDAVSVLTLRMGLSLPVFALSAFLNERRAKPLERRAWFEIVALGAGLYYGSALTDFWGLLDVSAGLERVILFTYPTWVVLFSSVLLRERLRARQFTALIITYAGIALAFASEHVSTPLAWRGAGWVLLSSVLYAGYLVGGTRHIRRMGAQRFTALALTFASATTVAHFALSGRSLPAWSPRVYGLGLGMALLCTVLPTFALAAGIRRIGPSSSAILGTIGPVSTLGLAFALLGEPIHGMQVLGTLMVLAGATWLAFRPR